MRGRALLRFIFFELNRENEETKKKKEKKRKERNRRIMKFIKERVSTEVELLIIQNEVELVSRFVV